MVFALGSHVTRRADVTRSDQPDARQGGIAFVGQSVYDEIQDSLDGALLRHVDEQAPNAFGAELGFSVQALRVTRFRNHVTTVHQYSEIQSPKNVGPIFVSDFKQCG